MNATPSEIAKRIAEDVAAYRIRPGPEAQVQHAVATIIGNLGFKFEREKELDGAGRIDFLVEGCVGVELKVAGSPSAVLRQVARYMNNPLIRELVLVSMKSTATRLVPAYFDIGAERKRIRKPDLIRSKL